MKNDALIYDFFVGIDVSKKTFDVGILSSQGERIAHKRFINNQFGFESFLLWINQRIQSLHILFVMEHTGLYSRLLQFYLQDQSCYLWMESGFQIKRGMGIIKGKSDKIDSYRIAEYALNRRYKANLCPEYDEDLVVLHDLLSTRNRLNNALKQLKQPINEMKIYGNKRSFEAIENGSKAAVEGLRESISHIENQITELCKIRDDWHENIELATSIKGIGKWTCLWILVYTRNFSIDFSSRKFASMAGIAPFGSYSGTSIKIDPNNSHFSHKFLKGILHTSALSSLKTNEQMRIYWDRKKQEGKKGFVILNNIKNKLVHQIFAVVRNKTPFDPNYIHKKAA